MTHNQIAWYAAVNDAAFKLGSLAETQRANRVTEKETNRHNVSTENIQRDAVNETVRSNKAREHQYYLNYLETERSNRAQEEIKRQMNDIAWANYREMRRNNLENNYLKSREIAEEIRRNTAQESLANRRLWSDYSLGYAANKTRQYEARTNRLKSMEQRRSNMANESIHRMKNINDAIGNFGRFAPLLAAALA